MAAASANKPKLDTLPNEVIQKIWELSLNPYLPQTSRKLKASLDNQHVRDSVWSKMIPPHLRFLIDDNNTKIECLEYLEREGITAGLLERMLKHTKITNMELWDMCQEQRDAWNASHADSPCHYPGHMTLRAFAWTRIPSRLLNGEVNLKVDLVDGRKRWRGGGAELVLEEELRMNKVRKLAPEKVSASYDMHSRLSV